VNALALALAVSLGAAKAAPPANPAAPAEQQPAPAAAEKGPAEKVPADKAGAGGDGAAAPGATAPADATPAAEEPVDGDVMGFLSFTNSTASRDGGVKLPWDGPGGAQLKLSWDALDKRNEQLSMGDMMARSLVEAVRMYFDTEGGLDPEAMRAKLQSLTGAPMEEARTAYLDAVTWEERRLFFVERAIAQADAERTAIPGIDANLVIRRGKAIRSGAVKKALLAQIDGYRDLALGLVAYLDGDNFKALERVRSAAAALPDFAVAHAFLGSMYFLFDQKDAAVKEWRRAYELDPTNEAVRAALQEYGRKERKQPSSQPQQPQKR
jgi:tetratricopeptide (TPR) repeat protein